MGKHLTAIGLMSGTSLDGIDVAIIRSDGEKNLERVPRAKTSDIESGIAAAEATFRYFQPYSSADQQSLRHVLDNAKRVFDEMSLLGRGRADRPLTDRQTEVRAQFGEAEKLITERYASAVTALLNKCGMDAREVDLVAMHGQTVLHRPDVNFTLQLGDGEALARCLGIPVVFDFRSNDIAAGGEGAPFVPAYHRALVEASNLERPAVVLNVGGVANVTYVGEDEVFLAFDTGPGNALIDDWMAAKRGVAMDCGGTCAAGGLVVERVLARLLEHLYFSKEPPKSLDRNEFSLAPLEGLSVEQGAATLTAFTALAVARADFFFPMPPRQWIVCGGGARNDTLMKEFGKRLDGEVRTAEQIGWSADFMEAEAFAYLGIRSVHGLPLSYPTTTGVTTPMAGGCFIDPLKLSGD